MFSRQRRTLLENEITHIVNAVHTLLCKIYTCVNVKKLVTLYFWCCTGYVGFEKNFRTESDSISQGLPYDFSSIMHFRHNAFSRSSYKSTVVPLNNTINITLLGSSSTGTDLDFLQLNIVYCGGREPKTIHCLHFVIKLYIKWLHVTSRNRMFYFPVAKNVL